MPDESNAIDIKTAQQVVAEQHAMILEHCKLIIEKVLLEHGCKLTALPEIVDGRIVASVMVEIDGSRV